MRIPLKNAFILERLSATRALPNIKYDFDDFCASNRNDDRTPKDRKENSRPKSIDVAEQKGKHPCGGKTNQKYERGVRHEPAESPILVELCFVLRVGRGGHGSIGCSLF